VKQTEKLAYSGNGTIQNATLNLSSLPKPLTVRNADLRFTANSVIANNVDFSLGETAARGELTLHNPAAPRVEFSFAADKINVRDTVGAVYDRSTSPAQPPTPSTNSLIRRVTGSGRLTVNTVVYDDLTLSNVNSTVQLDKGVITMNPITAGLYGGQQVGSVVLDARSVPAAYNVNLKLQDVDANQLLSTISPIKDGLYGVLSADADTQFTSAGGARGIAQSLDGRVSLNLQDGAIANMDLLHQMAQVAQFLSSGKTVDPVTKVVQLSGDFDINDGVAQTNNLKAATEFGSLAATGRVDLAQQRLNLRVTAVMSREYSERVGGTRIGGFMTTAVANRDGELVVPLIISGTFQDPQFAPDLQKVAELKLREIVPSADNILRQLLREKPGQEEEKQEEQRNPVPDILDRIFRGKP
jgi:AsmA protein